MFFRLVVLIVQVVTIIIKEFCINVFVFALSGETPVSVNVNKIITNILKNYSMIVYNES